MENGADIYRPDLRLFVIALLVSAYKTLLSWMFAKVLIPALSWYFTKPEPFSGRPALRLSGGAGRVQIVPDDLVGYKYGQVPPW